MPKVWNASTQSWYDTDDIQRDILNEQRITNRLLEQILSEMRHHFTEDGEKVHPGIIVPISNKEVKPVCLKCHRDAEIIHNCFGTGEDWVSCKHCGVTWRMQ